MAIVTATQKGLNVFVYNEKGVQILVKSGTLMGCTGSSVSVKNGKSIFTYDEKGRQLLVKSV